MSSNSSKSFKNKLLQIVFLWQKTEKLYLIFENNILKEKNDYKRNF